jgi:hypothetical protein
VLLWREAGPENFPKAFPSCLKFELSVCLFWCFWGLNSGPHSLLGKCAPPFKAFQQLWFELSVKSLWFSASSISQSFFSQALMAHACNPSYSGDRDQGDRGSKPAQGNSSQGYISQKKKTHHTKKDLWHGPNGMSDCLANVRPEFKSQYQ